MKNMKLSLFNLIRPAGDPQTFPSTRRILPFHGAFNRPTIRAFRNPTPAPNRFVFARDNRKKYLKLQDTFQNLSVVSASGGLRN